jgi:hypothetical protein
MGFVFSLCVVGFLFRLPRQQLFRLPFWFGLLLGLLLQCAAPHKGNKQNKPTLSMHYASKSANFDLP